MDDTTRSENSHIAKSASKVMLGGVFSLLAGLLSQVITAAMFGAGAGMDAYLTALVVPLYLQYVLLSGLSYVFIPAFVREQTKGNEDEAWALVGTFTWITTIVLTLLAALGSIFSTTIISYTAPGFDAEKSALAARMLSILMLTVPFSGLGSLTVSIQNARNRFFWPSFAGAINSLGSAATLLLLTKSLGPMALCWSFVVSIVLQSAVTIIPVIRHGWKKLLPLSDPRVREMGRLITPLILFGLLLRSSTVLERFFASGLPDGQISYIGYANKASNIFVTLLAMGISSAIFPSMARSYTLNGLQGLEEKNDYGIRLTFCVGLPAVLITGAVAVPFIHVLFQRGEFHSADTLGVSLILIPVLLGDVLIRMVSNILGRTFYVLKDTITPPLISSTTMLLYIAFGRFFVNTWGYPGLVWVRTIQMSISILCMWVLVQRKLPNTQLKQTIRRIFEYVLAAVVAYFASQLVVNLFQSIPAIFQLAAGGLVGLSLYLLILYWRDQEMITAIAEMSGIDHILMQFQNHGVQTGQKSIKSDS